MSNTIIRPKNRAEWLEFRNNGIGSSEVGTIMGLNPFETPYALWRRKRGMDAPKQETFAMKAGHYLEDAVAQFWQDATGKEVIKSSAGDWLIRNDAKPYLQVSPDRTYWLDGGLKRNEQNKGILECKTTQKTIDADDLPKHWFAQLQYQLGVAELPIGYLAWLTAGREFGYKEFAFLPDYFAYLVEEVERFWTDNIKGGQEPEAVDMKDILLKYNKHTSGKYVEVNEEVYQAYSDLKEVKERMGELEAAKTGLEETLKRAIQDAEGITYEGETLATWKASKDSEKFDAKAFQKDHPDMAKAYTLTVPGMRRFLLK